MPVLSGSQRHIVQGGTSASFTTATMALTSVGYLWVCRCVALVSPCDGVHHLRVARIVRDPMRFLQVAPADHQKFGEFLQQLGYAWTEETANEAYKHFL